MQHAQPSHAPASHAADAQMLQVRMGIGNDIFYFLWGFDRLYILLIDLEVLWVAACHFPNKHGSTRQGFISEQGSFLGRASGRINGDRSPYFEVAVHNMGKQLVGDNAQAIDDVAGYTQCLYLLAISPSSCQSVLTGRKSQPRFNDGWTAAPSALW